MRLHHFRRSSARSIGARSDFHSDIDDDEAYSRRTSVGVPDEEQEKERLEANEHVANYVNSQLEHLRSHESTAIEQGEEFEAQLD